MTWTPEYSYNIRQLEVVVFIDIVLVAMDAAESAENFSFLVWIHQNLSCFSISSFKPNFANIGAAHVGSSVAVIVIFFITLTKRFFEKEVFSDL